MDEAEDQCGTDPAPSADNPLEMHQEEATRTISWVLQLRGRMLYHHHTLELDATRKRDVALAYLGEFLQFMEHDRVLHLLSQPLAEVTRALEAGTRRSLAAYFKPAATPAGGQPPLDSRKRLVGAVAHLVEVLVTGNAFLAMAAAKKVADALNAAGCRMPNGSKFKAPTVTDWHEFVLYPAAITDLEREMYDALQLHLKQRHPEHVGWDRPRLERWLTETVPLMARNGYLNVGAQAPRQARQKKVV
jgi:hypothetical protein